MKALVLMKALKLIVERVELPALHQMGIYHRGRGGANDLAGAEWEERGVSLKVQRICDGLPRCVTSVTCANCANGCAKK